MLSLSCVTLGGRQEPLTLTVRLSVCLSVTGSVSHLGSAVVSSMNLTTDGLHPAGPAATSAAGADMMYYQNSSAALASAVAAGPAGAAAAEPPPPPPPGPAGPPDGGFLSQILGVDELQLMEMPMADGKWNGNT